jgi:hypothetical protein
MSKITLLFIALFAATMLFAQNENVNQNTAGKMLESDKKLSIGGYGQLDYNQPLKTGVYKNGTLDVHRLVLLFGYKFNERTNFVTEIEFEHVNEVYVEQAFLNYKINKWLNFRGGLMLIPMGIINEYHEPTTFNGVNRPVVDTKIIPTTWRELGAGFAGSLNEISLKYQAYVVNGFNGYNGNATINGNDAFRKARQKGIKSYISSPNFTTKVDYYGIRSLNIGASLYIGNTQSTIYNNISRSDAALVAKADSSVLKMTMTAIDAKYTHHGLQLRGQFVYAAINNSDAYNTVAKNANTNKGIGSAMMGYYIELGYNVFQLTKLEESELIPFVRYEKYNTQQKTDGVTLKNDLYDNALIVTGLGWKITPGTIVKADVEFAKNKSMDTFAKTLNLGIGVWF